VIDVANRAHPDDFSLADKNELDYGLSVLARALLKRELGPGERLLWAAESTMPPFPLGAGYLVGASIAIAPSAMGINLLYAYWQPLGKIEHLTGSMCWLAFGAILTACLVANARGRLKERRRKGEALSAITDRRAIVWLPEPTGDAIRIQTLARGHVGNLTRIERMDGSGTLEFSKTPNDFEYYNRFAFENVPDVRRAEQIVRNNLMTSERPA
jgi:hypothetical protein